MQLGKQNQIRNVVYIQRENKFNRNSKTEKLKIKKNNNKNNYEKQRKNEMRELNMQENNSVWFLLSPIIFIFEQFFFNIFA